MRESATLKRVLETVGQVYRYAIAHGHTRRNPATEFKPSDVLRPTKKVILARVDAKVLPQLLCAIEVYRGEVMTRLAMKLLALRAGALGHSRVAPWGGCRRSVSNPLGWAESPWRPDGSRALRLQDS